MMEVFLETEMLLYDLQHKKTGAGGYQRRVNKSN